MSESFKNKNVVITGAGRGIGKKLAESFLQEGARVVSPSRSLHEQSRVQFIECDVSDWKQVQSCFEKILNDWGHIDVLINNAGTQGEIGAFLQSNPEDWARAIHVNLFGVYNCTRMVLPSMVQRQSGRVINLSGGGSTSPRIYFSSYSCSKTAVLRFTETVAEEVKSSGVTINAIAPGAINTRMLEEFLEGKDRVAPEVYQEALRQKESGGHSLDKAVELVKFLASDRSKNITGKLIAAQHDDWKNFDQRNLNESDWFTLRRVDPYLFTIKR